MSGFGGSWGVKDGRLRHISMQKDLKKVCNWELLYIFQINAILGGRILVASDVLFDVI